MGTRRGNREGTFYQRANGRWEGRCATPCARTGAPHVRVRRDCKLAKAALEAKIGRIHGSLAVIDSASPLSSVAFNWRTRVLAVSDKGQSTKDVDASPFRLHIETSTLADISLSELTTLDVEEWILHCNEIGASPSSMHIDYTVLRAILDSAV